MTLTHNIVQAKMHENGMEMIRRGLALIAIDPRTGEPPLMGELMTLEEVSEVIGVLERYVARRSVGTRVTFAIERVA